MRTLDESNYIPAGLFAEVSDSFGYPLPHLPIGLIIYTPSDQAFQLYLKFFTHFCQFVMA